MSSVDTSLEARCADALREHLRAGSEHTLHEAYEIARQAVNDGLGPVDMASMMHHALLTAAPAGPSPVVFERFESFALECFSPFEMEYRGARDATRALRRMNERAEENVRRIAYELHDTAGQLLATVHFALDAAERKLGVVAGDALEPVRTRLHEVERELRRLSHELRPTLLDHLGLLPALRELAQGVGNRSGISIRVVDDTHERFPAPIETALYRIVQEAFNNAVRHSRASRIEVRVARLHGAVRCTIIDNGVGFERIAPDGTPTRPGLGLAGMAERLSPLAGSLRIDTSPGRGVRLDIHIPLEDSRVDSHPVG
jgi:signal transduction histidine kinase